MHVDFLIVAALRDEAAEIESRLTDVRSDSVIKIGALERWKGGGKFWVGVQNLFGMGTNNAQLAAEQAIAAYRPRAVFMTGIAAGFEDGPAKVQLGDLMVPYGMVPYELQKIRERRQPTTLETILGWFGVRRKLEAEHRGVAHAVSESVWRVAANLAEDQSMPWLRHVRVGRPDGAKRLPRVHVGTETIIGCGEKVVAHEEAEVRKWLLECYPRQALGLEMESFGVFNACRRFHTPFLLAKASVDRATTSKDDDWREYSCQLSAGFVLTTLERYELPVTGRLKEYENDVDAAARALERELPASDFDCRIRTAKTYEQLRRKEYDPNERTRTDLLPTDVTPTVVLYAGGGAGKTTIARRLFIEMSQRGELPALLDLKRVATVPIAAPAEEATNDTIARIVRAASIPMRTVGALQALCAEAPLVLIIDGANEVTQKERAAIVELCGDMRKRSDGGLRVVWTNRVASLDGVTSGSAGVQHATVSQVSSVVASRCFDDEFGAGEFAMLGDRLQAIMLRPFFLDLAIRSKRKFVGNRLWSGIFEEFLREHAVISSEDLDALSAALPKAIDIAGTFRHEDWLKNTPQQAHAALRIARVLDESHEFEHHLWRDFLFSRAFRASANWDAATFDGATTNGMSPDCVSLAVEQLDLEKRVTFVKAVYDWNYNVALECVAHSSPTEERERHLPSSLVKAILAVVAEKRFDPIPRTQERIGKLLSQFPFAKPFLDAKDRNAVVRLVQAVEDTDAWFLLWRRLFAQAEDGVIDDDDAARITDLDSLVGWTASNLARRGILSSGAQASLRSLYASRLSDRSADSIRWRVVHALGRWPTMENVSTLSKALLIDPYPWVGYGAARSLVEVAATSIGDLREKALAPLREFIADSECGGRLRYLVLREIAEACFVRDAEGSWQAAGDDLVDTAIQAEQHPERRSELEQRVLGLRAARAR